MKLFNNISMVLQGEGWFKYNINDITMGPNNLNINICREMKCSCTINECLANLIIRVLP